MNAEVITPRDVREIEGCVQDANARGLALQVIGGDSKRSIGRPDRGTTKISLSNFASIIDYDPAELVLTVGAGAKLSEIQALLESHGQMLAFEPGEWGGSTIGGVVGVGFAGPRRVSAGSVRDHVLGFTAVSGRGERFVAGGRVVKNVTGYDLPKLLCGSWGQLAILTEITLKVLPRPRVSLTLVAHGLDVKSASAAMLQALRSQADVSAAAYLPRVSAQSQTLLRLEGFGPSVTARVAMLRTFLPHVLEELNSTEAAATWQSLSAPRTDVPADSTLWRICVPATQCVAVFNAVSEWKGDARVDWGGALIWATLPTSLVAADIRACAEHVGGHATLIDAPTEYRQQVPALHPESAIVAKLSERVRAAFDPARVLDPQRFAV